MVCEHVSRYEIVAATGGMLLFFSVGSVVGPLVIPICVQFFSLGEGGIYICFAVLLALLFTYGCLEKVFLWGSQFYPLRAESRPSLPSLTHSPSDSPKPQEDELTEQHNHDHLI